MWRRGSQQHLLSHSLHVERVRPSPPPPFVLLPAPHVAQLSAPAGAKSSLLPHGVQPAAPRPANVPAVHLEHATLPGAAAKPSAQLRQTLWPGSGWKRPALQAVHAVWPALSAKVPAGHMPHTGLWPCDSALAAIKRPGTQAWHTPALEAPHAVCSWPSGQW